MPVLKHSEARSVFPSGELAAVGVGAVGLEEQQAADSVLVEIGAPKGICRCVSEQWFLNSNSLDV